MRFYRPQIHSFIGLHPRKTTKRSKVLKRFTSAEDHIKIYKFQAILVKKGKTSQAQSLCIRMSVSLFYSYALGQISGLINISAPQYSDMIGQQLQRDSEKDRGQPLT